MQPAKSTLQALSAAENAATSSTSTQMLHELLLATTRDLRADASQMALYDAEQDRFFSFALTADGAIVDHPPDFPREIPARGCALFEVLQKRRTPRVFDPRTEPELFWPGTVDYHRGFGSSVVQCIPLHFGDRFVGYMGLAFRQAPGLAPDDFEAALQLARQAAMAIELKRLADAEQASALERDRQCEILKRAALLERSNKAMQQTVDLFGQIDTLTEALPGVLRIVAQAFGAEYCAYCDHPDGTIFLRYWYWQGQVLGPESLPGLDASQMAVIRRLADGFTAPVAHLGTDAVGREYPVVVDHRAMAGDAEIQRFCLGMGWDQELNIPLMVDGRAVGGLVVYRSAARQFSEEEVALGAALAKQLALALQVTQRARREREVAVARERERIALVRSAELERSNAALQQTIDAAARLESLAAFVPQALRIVAAAFDARGAGFFELADGLVFLRYWFMDGKVYGPPELPGLPAAQFGLLIRMVEGFNVPDAYLGVPPSQQDRAVLIDHRIDGPAPEFDAFARAMDWAHEVNVPMLVEGRSLGSITLYRGAQYAFSESDVRLAESLSRPVALAVQTSKIAEREAHLAVEQRRFSELARANDALRVSLNALEDEEAERSFLRKSLQQIHSIAACTGIWLFSCAQPGEPLRLLGSVAQGGYRSEGLPEDPPMFREGFAMRPELLARLVAHGKLLWRRVDPDVVVDADTPESIRWHLRMGHRANALHALMVGTRQVGLIGMVFASDVPPSEAQLELIHTLCQPLTLALELTRLSHAARKNAARAAVLAERERMAAEIHDSLAQSFTSIALQAESLGSRQDRQSVDAQIIRCIEQTARQGLAEVRSSLLTLNALEGPPGTLDRALAQLALRSEVPGSMRCEFVARGEPCDVRGVARESLMRIAREALHNAMRHSDGSIIRIGLAYAEGTVLLTIDDDGKGIPTENLRTRSGHGLEGMAKRASEIGAQMRISVSEMGGTRVAVRLACSSQVAAGEVQ